MSLVIVNAGEAGMLTRAVFDNFDLRLCTNDPTSGLTPAEVDELDETDFTEATFTGYSAEALATGTWTITEGNPTEAVNSTKSFTSTADQTAEDITGYYVTRDADGSLVWFELFPGPITVEFNTDEIQITPRVTLDDAKGQAMEVGTITMWSTGTAPDRWLLCDGSAVSRTTYADLFATIGTTYGAGDGSTTFELPDLRQRFPLGVADSGTGSTLAGTGGAIDHVHGLDSGTSHAKLAGTALSNNFGWSQKSVDAFNENRHVSTTITSDTDERISGVELGGDSDTANPPFLALNFVIYAGV